jgi:hypothetical protein
VGSCFGSTKKRKAKKCCHQDPLSFNLWPNFLRPIFDFIWFSGFKNIYIRNLISNSTKLIGQLPSSKMRLIFWLEKAKMWWMMISSSFSGYWYSRHRPNTPYWYNTNKEERRERRGEVINFFAPKRPQLCNASTTLWGVQGSGIFKNSPSTFPFDFWLLFDVFDSSLFGLNSIHFMIWLFGFWIYWNLDLIAI